MELGTRDTLLTFGVGAMWLVGVALILRGDLVPGVTGIVLLVLSIVVFMADVRDVLVRAHEQHASE